MSNQQLKRILYSAFKSAWHSSLGDQTKIPDLATRHANRSRLFVRELGRHFDDQYHEDQYIVHWKRTGESVTTPGETMHDINVFQVDQGRLLQRPIWQIESEFAFKYVLERKIARPKPKDLLEDLNKLICGCAENSLFVTSEEWNEDGQLNWFQDTIERAARNWYNCTNGEGNFYVATVPFVYKWHCLEETELECKLIKFNYQNDRYIPV